MKLVKALPLLLFLLIAGSCGKLDPQSKAPSPQRAMEAAKTFEQAPLIDSIFSFQTQAGFVSIWPRGLVSLTRAQDASHQLFLPLQTGFWVHRVDYLPTGKVIWIYVGFTDGIDTAASVLAIDPQRSRILWEVKIPQEYRGTLVVQDSTIIVLGAGRVCRISMDSGESTWNTPGTN